jgi:hypothetical protein
MWLRTNHFLPMSCSVQACWLDDSGTTIVGIPEEARGASGSDTRVFLYVGMILAWMMSDERQGQG